MSKPKTQITTNSGPAPTKARFNEDTSSAKSTVVASNLMFGKKNFLIMLGGLALIFIGLLLMAGGKMPSPDVWDESIIYSTRRVLIAPIFILCGLGAQFFAIFAKKD